MSLRGALRFLWGHPFNRGRRLTALGRFAKWQLVSRLYPDCAISTPWIDDVRLLVHRGETGVTGNLYAGLHEFEEMAFALHLLRQGDLFIDIGANSGAFTLLACGAAGADGIAVEPVPSAFRRLEDHLQLNRLASRVASRNIGLGDRSATMQFTAGLDTQNRALAPGEVGPTDTVKVQVETLDDLAVNTQPVLIKIDVEGFEPNVLQGGRRTLESKSLLAVIVELNGCGRRYGFRDEDSVDTMLNLGFSIAVYDPFSRSLTKTQPPKTFTGNQIFVRDLDHARERCRTAARHSVFGREI